MSVEKKTNWTIPLRFKIAAMIASSLVVSFVAYLWVGTSLIIEDKVSYVYDFTMTQVHGAAGSLDHHIKSVLRAGSVFSKVIPPKLQENSSLRASLQRAYEITAKEDDLSGLAFFSTPSPEQVSEQAVFNWTSQDPRSLLTQLGWTPSAFQKNSTLLAGIGGEKLAVASLAQDSNGKPVLFSSILSLKLSDLEVNKQLNLHLFDSSGKFITEKNPHSNPLRAIDTTALVQTLLSSQFASGVQDWTGKDSEYIVGYEKLFNGQLLVVGFVPRELAFAASRSLVLRSLILGISILLFAVGFTLLFGRRLTHRLREMWHATRKVSEGDFSCRVDLTRSGRDELGDLAISFNAMADKISDLMAQTAEKARMEKELEMAQAVQTRFFPSELLKTRTFELKGKSISATECGGDWWHYDEIGEHVLVMVGDVTGHGVSAALVTAAAHGAYSAIVDRFKAEKAAPDLSVILGNMDTTIRTVSEKNTTMTLIASLINTRTGEMQFVNAAHPSPLLYRNEFRPLLGELTPPLGALSRADIRPMTVQLEPNDVLFWHTDGLIEAHNPDGKKLSKARLARLLEKLILAQSGNAEQVCEQLFSEAELFFQERILQLPDDITFMVGSVPKEAKFS